MMEPRKIGSISELARRAQDNPSALTRAEICELGLYVAVHRQNAVRGKRRQEAIASAEGFRRRMEIGHIFRGLTQHLRDRPSADETKQVVIQELKKIGIKCSERTLQRDYGAMGGAAILRGAKPFDPGEDKSRLISEEAVTAAKVG